MNYDYERSRRAEYDEPERRSDDYWRYSEPRYRESPAWRERYETYGSTWGRPTYRSERGEYLDYDRWPGRGPYAGRGPSGYQRSDERIREEVMDRLAHHGRIDATNIQVRVEDRMVTLEGTVSSRRTKRRAEDVADSVMGVRDVHNRLRIEAEREGQPAASVDQSRMREGMQVVGLDGDDVGQVKEVRDSDFLVDRAFQRDVYVPFEAVNEVSGNWVVLTIPADRVDEMNWENPPILGGPEYGYGYSPYPGSYYPPYYPYGAYGAYNAAYYPYGPYGAPYYPRY